MVEQPLDRDGDVVVDAEARRRRPASRGAARRRSSPRARPRPSQTAGRTSTRARDDPGAGLVHAREGRVVLGAQPARRGRRPPGRPTRPAPRRRSPASCTVSSSSSPGTAGSTTSTPSSLEQAERLAQPGGEVEPDRVHRVARPEVVAREALVPDHPGLCWHDGHATGRPRVTSRGCRQGTWPTGHDRRHGMGKNRLYDDDVLVIGLGRFGAAAALELHRLGHTVVAVEKDSYLAEAYSRKLSRVIQADAAAPDAADLARMRSFRLAVVGIGSSVEASVLTAGNLVDAGVPVDLGQGGQPRARADPRAHRRRPRHLTRGRLGAAGGPPGQRQAAGLHRVRRRLRDRQDGPAARVPSGSPSTRARSAASTA